jgi:hypothetical protein
MMTNKVPSTVYYWSVVIPGDANKLVASFTCRKEARTCKRANPGSQIWRHILKTSAIQKIR